MNNFALEIWDDDATLVTFYTVRNENDQLSETDKFITKFKDHPDYKEKLQEIIALLLDAMGEETGAHKAYFSRNENHASALPPSSVRVETIHLRYPEFPLRLYCYRKSDHLVILFNGDVKNVAKVKDDPRLFALFNQANNYVKRIEDAFKDGLLQIDDHRIIRDFQGNTEIIL
jgi:hypothetical protein